MKASNLLLKISLLLDCFLLMGLTSCRKSVEIDNVIPSMKQSIQVRAYLNSSWLLSSELTNENLSTSALMAIGENGQILCYSYRERKILIFNTDKGLIRKIGNGLGQRDGQFNNPLDLKIAADGSIYVCDPELSRITKWNKNGEHENSYSLDIIPQHFAIINNQGFVVQSIHTKDGLFAVYDSSFTKLQTIHKLSTQVNKNHLLYEGVMTSDQEAFYYCFIRYGVILRYAISNGKVSETYAMDLIEKVKPPKLISKKIKGMTVKKLDDEAKYAAADMDLNEKFIFIIFSGLSHSVGSLIDVYDKQTGRYLSSHKLDFEAAELRVRKNHVYLKRKNTIRIYSLPPETQKLL